MARIRERMGELLGARCRGRQGDQMWTADYFYTRTTAMMVGVAVLLTFTLSSGQTATYKASRSPYGNGRPNLDGIWQAVNTAYWNIKDHPAQPAPIVAMGAWGAIPGGLGVVDGNEIPYRPEALAKKKDNFDERMALDPEIKCYLPGVPRAMYMPYPFQIVQTPTDILIAYEFASASRIVRMNSKAQSPTDSWMGWSRGRWEGDTLVVDVTDLGDQTWFDR